MKIKEAYQTAKILTGITLATIAGGCAAQQEYTYDTRAKMHLPFLSREAGKSVYNLCEEADTNNDSVISDSEMRVLEDRIAPWAFKTAAAMPKEQMPEKEQEPSESEEEPARQEENYRQPLGRKYKPGPCREEAGRGAVRSGR
ncbi:hypothetical protein KY338_05700 [Candidatus Woesearchaeota archaeon]|nr:hypothetical protein [Candidatus Woesearchaeota archaeon]MBW3006440.1 hypothetical protein [Candidatus Woesearchaeota archaeon]